MILIRKYKYYVMAIIMGLFYYTNPTNQPTPIQISPDSFLHKFPGRVTVDDLRPWPGVLSVAQISPGLCRISITPKTIVGEKEYECLYLVELANCNGAFDVNADARRRVVPAGYERTCESTDWSPIYNQLKNESTEW